MSYPIQRPPPSSSRPRPMNPGGGAHPFRWQELSAAVNLCWQKKVVVFFAARCLHPTCLRPNNLPPTKSFMRSSARLASIRSSVCRSNDAFGCSKLGSERARARMSSSPRLQRRLHPRDGDVCGEFRNLGFWSAFPGAIRCAFNDRPRSRKSSLEARRQRTTAPPNPFEVSDARYTMLAYLRAVAPTGVLRAPARISELGEYRPVHPFRWLPVTCP